MSDSHIHLNALSLEERSLFVMRMLQARAEVSQSQAISKRRNSHNATLSFAQQRLWFIDQLEPDGYFYNVSGAIRLSGRLKQPALEQSLQEIVRRHEVLRTSFSNVDGEPRQVIAAQSEFALPLVDLGDVTPEAQQAEVEQLAAAEAQRPFDLASGPLLRGTLLRLSDEEHVLLLTMHHIVSDGWSVGILIRELTMLYDAFSRGEASPLPVLPIQYADFAEWQRGRLQGEELEAQLKYWREQLAGVEVLELPTDRPRPAVQSYRGTLRNWKLSTRLTEQLKELSRREGVTLFMTLLAGFQLLLSRYTGQQDIAIGTPIANRNRKETEGLIGFFVNTLVLRTRIDGEMSFRELLKQVREAALGAYAHQDLPFERLVEELHPERSLSRNPLFQVMFALQNAPMPSTRTAELSFNLQPLHANTAAFELQVALHDGPEGLVSWFEYNSDIFDPLTIERMAVHYRTLLEDIVNNPDKLLSELQLITANERRRLLLGFNDTRKQYPENSTIPQLFEEQADRKPEALALVYGHQQLTYRELNEKANQLARYLVRQGVGPEILVGICLERSVEMVVGLLGILKAGAAYVPLDPTYPQDRLSFMLEDAQVAVLLTHERSIEKLPKHQAQVICLDSQWPVISRESADNLVSSVGGENLAYMIYTSGSTGRPKGAMNTHRGICNRLLWMQDAYRLDETDRVLQKTPFSFDVSVWEFFWPLITGARLIVAEPEIHKSSTDLARLIEDQQVTTIHFVPSMLQVFVADGGLKACRSLRRVICSGEALSFELQEKFYRNSSAQLHNLYGPTEAAVDVTYWSCERAGKSRTVPIGRPIANTQIYLLDKNQNIVPVGVPGELYIGGAGPGRGYWNRPDLTAEKFVPNPYSQDNGERLYRTGDLAKYRADGQIEFLGRIDQQIKLRGFRIELEEIQAVLEQHPAVRDCVAIVREDVSDDKRLVAYFTAAESAPTISELRSYMKERLPEYMIPSAFVQLEALPLTPNGKIDRRALPAPDQSALSDAEYIAPRTPVEELLAGIWIEVLGVQQAGVHDNFFDLGGHSLLATQVVSRIRKLFGVELSVQKLFEEPTIAGLAASVEEEERLEGPTPLVPVSRDKELRLSFAQQRLWFFDQLEPGSYSYNMPAAMRLSGRLKQEALEQSFQEIVRRHEVLRTSFSNGGGEPRQVVAAQSDFALQLIDLGDLTPEARQAKVEQLVAAEAQRPFDLGRGPLLRGTLLRLSDEEHVLLLTMHHIVSDGWSMGILIRELASLYEAFSRGEASPLPVLPIQYADFAEWQRGWLQGDELEAQLKYWREQLAGVEVLELPTDRARPAVQSYRGATLSHTFSATLSKELNELSRREGVTLFMTLLAGFQLLLSRYSGQQDIAVGTPIANRNRKEIEGLIGFFVNTLVLRSRISGGMSFRELLGQVREAALGAYAHQDLPFEKLVEELHPERSLSHNPLFQVMFNFSEFQEKKISLSGISAEPLTIDNYGSKFDLTLYAQQGAQIRIDLVYNADLFEQARMIELIEQFNHLLSQIAERPERQLDHFSLVTSSAVAYLPDPTRPLHFEWLGTIHHRFSQQAYRVPQRTAVVDKDTTWTYKELEDRSNQLANYLCARGVQKQDVVAVYGHRGASLVWALLGILKAGAAFTVLDPAYPVARLIERLRIANPRGWIQLAPTADIPASLAEFISNSIPHCRIEVSNAELMAYPVEPPDVELSSEDLAYLAFTSGSTGTPKAILGTHAPVSHFLHWHIQTFGLHEFDRFSMLSGLSHDPLLRDIFTPLSLGATLSIPDPEQIGLPGWLTEWMEREAITVTHLTPAMEQIVTMASEATVPSLRYAFFGGDVLKKANVTRLKTLAPAVTCVNFYGTTETPQAVGFNVVPQSNTKEVIPIGSGIEDVQLLILTPALQLAGIGEVGEICVRTPYLSKGYLGDETLTDERYIANPLTNSDNDRICKTGDLARYGFDGQLEFVGRADAQVKIRGFRVELGEIETALLRHPAIRESVVIAEEDASGDKRLIAYLVSDSERLPGWSEWRSYLEEQLPDYMIPSAFVQLQRLPLTPNGKLDYRALPRPGIETMEREQAWIPPRTSTEKTLVEIWRELLSVERIGVNDNFFELGGHSLLATQLVYRMRNAFQTSLPLRQVFESPTIGTLSVAIEKANRSAQAARPVITTVSREKHRMQRSDLKTLAAPKL